MFKHLSYLQDNMMNPGTLTEVFSVEQSFKVNIMRKPIFYFSTLLSRTVTFRKHLTVISQILQSQEGQLLLSKGTHHSTTQLCTEGYNCQRLCQNPNV